MKRALEGEGIHLFAIFFDPHSGPEGWELKKRWSSLAVGVARTFKMRCERLTANGDLRTLQTSIFFSRSHRTFLKPPDTSCSLRMKSLDAFEIKAGGEAVTL